MTPCPLRRADIGILIGAVILPPVLLLLFRGNFFFSIVFYFVIPSVYFSFASPRVIPKAAIAAIATIPFVVVLDFIAFFNHTWAVPTIFPFRFLTFVPLEDFWFTFSTTYFTVMVFQAVFLRDPPTINAARLKMGGGLIAALLAVFLWLYRDHTAFMRVPYYYAWLLFLVFVVPAILLVRYRPRYRSPLVVLTLYFFVLMFPYELTADYLGFWTFPSNEYLGMLNVWGFRFPLEEFFAWIVFSPVAVIAFTECLAGRSLPQGR